MPRHPPPYAAAARAAAAPTIYFSDSLNPPPSPEGGGGGQSVQKVRRPQKLHKFGERTTRCRFFLLIHSKYCWPLRGAFLLSASCASYRIDIRLQRRTPCPCSLFSDSLRACQKHSFLTRSEPRRKLRGSFLFLKNLWSFRTIAPLRPSKKYGCSCPLFAYALFGPMPSVPSVPVGNGRLQITKAIAPDSVQWPLPLFL